MTDKFKALRDALARLPVGWDTAFNNTQTQSEGVVRIGATDEDGNFYDVMEIDTEKYYEEKAALPTAQYIVAANPGTIRALLAEVEALRQKAARYDWLLTNWGYVTETYTDGGPYVESVYLVSKDDGWDTDPDSLDAAIDAAIDAAQSAKEAEHD